MSFSRPPLNSFPAKHIRHTHLYTGPSSCQPPSPPPNTHTHPPRFSHRITCTLSYRHRSSWDGRCVPVCVHVNYTRGHAHSHTHPETEHRVMLTPPKVAAHRLTLGGRFVSISGWLRLSTGAGPGPVEQKQDRLSSALRRGSQSLESSVRSGMRETRLCQRSQEQLNFALAGQPTVREFVDAEQKLH